MSDGFAEIVDDAVARRDDGRIMLIGQAEFLMEMLAEIIKRMPPEARSEMVSVVSAHAAVSDEMNARASGSGAEPFAHWHNAAARKLLALIAQPSRQDAAGFRPGLGQSKP